MKVWIVFVRQLGPAGEIVCRWIDSMWAEDGHAVSRAVEVRDSMKACGALRHEVIYTTAEIADAVISPDLAKARGEQTQDA